ncbi:Permease of the major facilitator superfamily [Hahella chejuensis KCTC 2396]|uniref:Permease of the major facilitator superfamily n=1 Tax=Hahella chejuensis (strain KCTC 2396) TaxID=349521 RepID=Q2S8D0_HAHCH|nr:DUF6064 family protein [Hahella chejuensis]ABC33094.1 Permease of the major facilitator superfamily [Hahella chejuensis KCTC 2396]
MSEWWTYSPEHFLLFSNRVYWRLFEMHNQAWWPWQWLFLLIGIGLLALMARPRPWSGKAVGVTLAALWLFVAWAFLWRRYAVINWAVEYVAYGFAAQAVLLCWLGVIKDRLRFAPLASRRFWLGASLFLYALLGHPLTTLFFDRPLAAAEVFGMAPDPLAIGSMGIVTAMSGGVARWLLPAPGCWCVASWLTLDTMAEPCAWIPMLALFWALAACWLGRKESPVPF